MSNMHEPENPRFAVKEPYPEVRVAGRNLYYARLLLDDYASNLSELNAINQYLYHHFRFRHRGLKDIAKLEEALAIVEMGHMEILADLILQLGGDPHFKGFLNNNQQYYSAAYVYYGHSVLDMLAADAAAERGAIIQYRKHVEIIEDPYIKAILNRIIKDEELHLKLFTEALRHYQSLKVD